MRTAAAGLALAAVLMPAAAFAGDTDPGAGDPNLTQTIDPNDPLVDGPAVLSTGHVDMGPKFDGTTWRFLIHDDAHKADANAQSVWRDPAETVLQVVDAAQLPVPEGDTYAFVGAAPGTKVWVVPQTQSTDVVWAGWNTQDPTVMSKLDRGATFSVDGVQGPGVLTVSLQSGDFGAPQILWDSRESGPQEVFVDTNTHTHANWIFTEPGVYLVEMTAKATLIDGSAVSDTEYLRFAVGSDTPTEDALTATWEGAASSSPPASADPAEAPPLPVAGDGPQDPVVIVLIVVIAVVALALIAGFTIVLVRGNRARKRALAARATAASSPASSSESDDGSGK